MSPMFRCGSSRFSTSLTWGDAERVTHITWSAGRQLWTPTYVLRRFLRFPLDLWLELWLDNDMSNNELRIDQAAADQIFELVRDLHRNAATSALNEGDTDTANAVADNWQGLLVNFGVKA